MTAVAHTINKMRVALIIALIAISLTPLWSSVLLKAFYRACYAVEFGPKYTQVAGRH